MTSIRNLLHDAVGVGERFCVDPEERDGDLVAAHPLESSPFPIVVEPGDVIDGEELPREAKAGDGTPEVEVEITDQVREGRVIGRVVGPECAGVDSGSDSGPNSSSNPSE